MATSKNTKTPKGTISAALVRGAIGSIWFPHAVDCFNDVKKRRELTPEAALCLLTMVTEGVSSSSQIEMYLGGFYGGAFGRTEAKVIAKAGLDSLKAIEYVRLDAKGKQELEAQDSSFYGLENVQWVLSAKGARAMAPIYCSCKGLPSDEQEAAVKDMLAANKASVSANRKRLKAAA
ncbi:MAG: hypothetical protein FHP94_03225 [Denitromonas halophila]|nr:MAG: hypothetical protein FHP94_03225 [Denitromonas halophila]TVT72868.1 MAG: hypothetical protein FHP93_07725 [Denitromonas halophila]